MEQNLNYDITHKTVHNNDIYRTSAAINVFYDQLKETIKVYQAGDKADFIEGLKARNKKQFYVKEQRGTNPDFERLFYGSNDVPEQVG